MLGSETARTKLMSLCLVRHINGFRFNLVRFGEFMGLGLVWLQV